MRGQRRGSTPPQPPPAACASRDHESHARTPHGRTVQNPAGKRRYIVKTGPVWAETRKCVLRSGKRSRMLKGQNWRT